MKKILKKSIAILLSLLMLSTGLVSAFADDNNCKLTIGGQIYAGTQKTATAQIKGLDKNTANEIKSSGGFDWKATCTNVTNYTVKVAATPAVKLNEESDGTYTLSQNATVTLPSVDNSTRPVIAVTATTKDSSYTCAQSFTVKIPYSKIDVEFVEDASGTNNSSYDSNSSTLYIDQEESATLKPTVKPNDNDDSIDVAVSDPADKNLTKHVSYTSNDSDGTYTFTVSKRADLISSITFSGTSAVGTVKNITLKKCIPLDSFNVIYDNKAYSDNQSIPSVVEGDIIKIGSTIKPTNSNDEIKYTLYNDSSLTEVDTLSTIILDDNKLGCTIIPKGNDSSTKYLLAEAVSMENSGIPRTVSHVVKIPVQQANPITSINFKQSDYTIYTEKNNQIELSGELETNPAQNYTDNVYYESSDTSIAVVDKDKGTVTAKNAGTVTITAHASRGNTVDKTASCNVTVKQAVKSIGINIDGFDSKITPTLTVGHKFKISATKNPSNAEEDIKIYTNDTDYLKIENGIIEAIKDCSDNVYIKAVSSVTAKEMTIPVKIVPAIRTSALTIKPTAVGNTTLLKSETQENTYSIYSGETINIEYTALSISGEKANDVIEWRIVANNSALMTIEEAKKAGYITSTSKFDNNILTVQTNSKNNDILKFTAYALMAGMSIDDADVVKSSIVINNNTKTTNIKTTTGTSKLQPCGTSFSDTIQLEPYVSTNNDHIYIESTNKNVATVSFVPGADNRNASFTVNTISNGVASINIYALAVKDDISTAVKTKTINLTVTNNIENATVQVKDVVYNGKAQAPTISVYFDDIELRKDDYSVKYTNNTNVGKATVTITGKNNYYQGTKTVYFNILPKNIENAGITVANVTYNANEQKPNVTVKDKDRNVNLAKNKDYTVTYQNNVNAGTASVIVTGINNYTGTAMQSFTISTLDITKAKINAIPKQSYVGASVTPMPTITYANRQLTNGVDFTVTYSNNNFPGTGKATITGIGNFKGSKELTFKIVGDISKATVTGLSPITQTGKAITVANFPAFRVSLGKDLVANTDYTLAYANNTLPGIATITITGKGNYTGKLTVNFTINKKSSAPSGATKVSGDYVNKKYKKANIRSLKKGKKSITVKWKKVKSIKGYQIEYSTSKKFTKKTSKKVLVSKQKKTSTAIKNLKAKKTYYVRIRTYKNVKFNGKTVKVYSSWSKSKSVKTK